MTKYAIVISINQNANFSIGKKDLGSIIAHADHIERVGGVLYDIKPPGPYETSDSFPHNDKNIKTGYFYNVPEHAVTHTFKIEYIKSYSEIKNGRQEKYVPPCRKEDFRNNPSTYYWILVKNIYRLKKDYKLKKFKKVRDNKPLERLQTNYSIVRDPEFAYITQEITMKSAVNDYITDNLLSAKMHERDIENLFYHILAPGTEFKDRQHSFKREGRLDLLVKKDFNFEVFEIKRGIANVSTLKQIKRYIKACIHENKGMNVKNVRGTILARTLTSDLKKALKRVSNIKAKEYFFFIDYHKNNTRHKQVTPGVNNKSW